MIPTAASSAAVAERLRAASAAPWDFSFTTLLRYLDAHQGGVPPIGTAISAGREGIRLGQVPALTFAPSEIAAVELDKPMPRLRMFSLGMLGPDGPLPLHYTEMIKQRQDHLHDATMVNFLDMFHHRAMSMHYRAWAGSQSAAGLDRADDETFSRYVSRLAGDDPEEIRLSLLPPHARLAAAAHRVSEARGPDALAATLAHYWAMPVRIEEYVTQWIEIAATDRSYLGRASAVLGVSALIGEKVRDRQHCFRIVLGPLPLAQYLRFAPGGEDLAVLVEWVRAFVGLEFSWEVELLIESQTAPASRLGGEERLGRSCWLGTGAVRGVTFAPELLLRAGKGGSP